MCEQRPSLVLLRKEQLEADMQRLFARENDHRRRVEEHRIRAVRHERRALVLMVRVADLETQLTGPDDEHPG